MHIIISLFLSAFIANHQILSQSVCERSLQSLESLRKAVNFYKIYYKEIDFDGLSGFLLLENYLKNIPKYSVNQKCSEGIFGISRQISNLLKMLNKINVKAQKWVLRKTPTYFNKMFKVLKLLMKPTLNWKNLHSNHKKNDIHDVTSLSISNYDEEFGDDCMAEIIDKNCQVSDQCFYSFVDFPIGRKYLATHQLIYLQLYRNNFCYLKNIWQISKKELESKIESYCKALLKENEDFMAKYNTSSSHLIDIFMERIVLCGGQNRFVNFLSPSSFSLLQQHQNPKSGCYGGRIWKKDRKPFLVTNKSDQVLIISKRRNSIMAGHCNSHTLGLGAAAYGAFLQKFFSSKII